MYLMCDPICSYSIFVGCIIVMFKGSMQRKRERRGLLSYRTNGTFDCNKTKTMHRQYCRLYTQLMFQTTYILTTRQCKTSVVGLSVCVCVYYLLTYLLVCQIDTFIWVFEAYLTKHSKKENILCLFACLFVCLFVCFGLSRSKEFLHTRHSYL